MGLTPLIVDLRRYARLISLQSVIVSSSERHYVYYYVMRVSVSQCRSLSPFVTYSLVKLIRQFFSSKKRDR